MIYVHSQIFALVVPEFETILNVLGATAGSSLSYTLPAIFALMVCMDVHVHMTSHHALQAASKPQYMEYLAKVMYTRAIFRHAFKKAQQAFLALGVGIFVLGSYMSMAGMAPVAHAVRTTLAPIPIRLRHILCNVASSHQPL